MGDTVSFGSYEQDGDAGNGEEAIDWIAVKASDDGERLLLVSRDVLDWMQLNDTAASVTWETCTLRGWLNDSFYGDCFTAQERERIVQSALDNPDNGEQDTVGGAQTSDAVFLLSLEEANALDDAVRTAQPTQSAVGNGAFENTETGSTWWMLRSPGAGNDLCAIVRSDGDTRSGGEKVSTAGGVRPAMWVTVA